MVNVTITDPVSRVGIVLDTKYYEDALNLIKSIYGYCQDFKRLKVTIEWVGEEE